MNVKLWIILICGILIYNTYHENNLFKNLKNYKKYYKMGLIVVFGLGVITIMNKSPKMNYESMSSLNHFIQMMPIDRNSKDMITPFLSASNPEDKNNPYQSIQKIKNSGNTSNKRSVSETKKKWVASQQEWKCNHCNLKLSAWFEVDHKKRLEYGGTNEVNNLEALCRECHGKKTAMENRRITYTP